MDLEVAVSSKTSSSPSGMSYNLFFAVEVFEEVDNFVALDLARALALEGFFRAVDFFTGLVFCSIVESSMSRG